MEKLDSENKGKKRGPVDSDLQPPEEGKVDSDASSPEAKRVRTDSDVNSPEFGRVDSAELGLESGEASQIPNDILGILDEPDTVPDDDPGIQDLDSVIKSFEEEILYPSPPPPDLFSAESGETQPDLGYLLEASDDELGLPPTVSPSTEETETKSESRDLATVGPDAAGAERCLVLEDGLPSYDSLGFGMGEETKFDDSELGAVGDLFENESGDFSEFLYRPESLQAL